MPDSSYLQKSDARRIVFLVLSSLLAQLALAGFVVFNTHSTTDKVKNQTRNQAILVVLAGRKQCALSKAGSRDSAKFQRTLATFVEVISGAKSVQQDVKTASKTALKVFNKTAQGAEHRAKRNCSKAFKLPEKDG